MTDKWEVLTLDSNGVTIINTKGYRRQGVREFLLEKGKNKGVFADAISFILADGWEPFATGCYGSEILNYSFRRSGNS